jgi:hypothetical protein
VTRRVARLVAVGALALAASGCGVGAEYEPEPLPSPGPAILPPSVTQEPAHSTPQPASPPTSSAAP